MTKQVYKRSVAERLFRHAHLCAISHLAAVFFILFYIIRTAADGFFLKFGKIQTGKPLRSPNTCGPGEGTYRQ